MKMKKTMIWLMIVECFICAKYVVSSKATCTKKEEGICVQWEQTGEMQMADMGCFPKHAKVLVWEEAQVTKRMEELKVGDLVLGWDGHREVYSPVLTWLHREPGTVASYWKVTTDGGDFVSSQLHNIGLADGSYAFTADLNGTRLHSGLEVLAVEQVEDEGLFTPYTGNNNYFVLTDNGQKVLAHDFANVRYPRLHEPSMKLFLTVWNFLYGEPDTIDGMHPLAKWTKETFPYFVEE